MLSAFSQTGDGAQRALRDASEFAAELAEHFEEGLNSRRAVKYLRVAAEIAQRRLAHREAELLLQRALRLVSRIPQAERVLLETDTLERLATTHFAPFDIRCIQTFEALVARASQYGLLEVETRALVDLAYCLSWISVGRALELLDRALQLSEGLSSAGLKLWAATPPFDPVRLLAMRLRSGVVKIGRHGPS